MSNSIAKKKEPLVTAIITTYKRPVPIVERALSSIINQDYKNLEIIVVNDCPEDKTLTKNLELMINGHKKDANIKYIVLKKNSGACKARNIGIENSNGKYIGFLDDDDEWKENKITKMVAFLSENPEYRIAYSNAEVYNEAKNITTLRFKAPAPSGNIHNELFYKNIIGSCSFPLFETSILKEHHGFSENMPAMQDWELYLRITINNLVGYIDEPLTKYYKYEGERISKNSKKRREAFDIIIKKFANEIEKDNNLIYTLNILGSNVYSIDNDIKGALSYWYKAVKIKPQNLKKNTKQLLKVLLRKVYKKNNL